MADSQSARSIAYTRAPFSRWLGIVCLFVLFGLIVLAVIGPSPRTSDYEETRAKKRMEKLKALQEENHKELTTYAWVDKNKGVARIPIDRAMEVTVTDLAQKKPAPAVRSLHRQRKRVPLEPRLRRPHHKERRSPRAPKPRRRRPVRPLLGRHSLLSPLRLAQPQAGQGAANEGEGNPLTRYPLEFNRRLTLYQKLARIKKYNLMMQQRKT